MKKINLREFFGDPSKIDAASALMGAIGGAGAVIAPLAVAGFVGNKRRQQAQQQEIDAEKAQQAQIAQQEQEAQQKQYEAQRQAQIEAQERLKESGHLQTYISGINPLSGTPWNQDTNFGTIEHINSAIIALDKHAAAQEEKRILGASAGKMVVPGTQTVNLTATQQKQIAAERKARFEEIMARISHSQKVHQGNEQYLRRIADLTNSINAYLGFRPETGFFPSDQRPLVGNTAFHSHADSIVSYMDNNLEIFPVPPRQEQPKRSRRRTQNESVIVPSWFNRI